MGTDNGNRRWILLGDGTQVGYRDKNMGYLMLESRTQ